MTTLILLAAGLGLGLWAVAVWLFPPTPPLTELVARVCAPMPAPPAQADPPGRVRRPDGASAGSLGRSVSALAPPALVGRVRARRRRAQFRQAVGGYLDLVDVLLAGGASVDDALREAASLGAGWPFEEIRRALGGAEPAPAARWAGLGRLVAAVGAPELAQLAAVLSLANVDEVTVRASVAATAEALRARTLADADATLAWIGVPTALTAVGLVAFTLGPALSQAANSAW